MVVLFALQTLWVLLDILIFFFAAFLSLPLYWVKLYEFSDFLVIF